MIHCKNYNIKCKDNPYHWCSSTECPYYKYNGVWVEGISTDHLSEDEKIEILRRFGESLYSSQIEPDAIMQQVLNERFWDLI